MISNTVTSLMLQLAAALREEGEAREGPEVNQTLLQLVREAFEIIGDVRAGQESRLDLRDWLHAAEPFVKS